MVKTLLACFFLISLTAVEAHAGAPTDQVKTTVDNVLEILKDKELKKPEKTSERRTMIRKAVDERFDFEEMAKRSLALYWKDRSPEERKEFIPLYSDLLERAYIRKIERYTDEKVQYVDESVKEEYALVRTRIVTKENVEIPVEYRLLKKGEQWEVYDVVVEGVSLVNNYRTQFNRIIRRHSYEELVKRMKSKQEGELAKEAK